MKRYGTIPSTSALTAFESAARHCNFSRAAQELNTSQSAISRHVADLEIRLGTKLFERHGKTLRLNDQGRQFHHAVVVGLDTIHNASQAISAMGPHGTLTIACTHEISHLYLMPRYENLQEHTGSKTPIRIMTYEYDAIEEMIDPRVDVMFAYLPLGRDTDHQVLVMREAVRPVCAPALATRHELSRHNGWLGNDAPFLDLSKQNLGWATWQNWFDFAGQPETPPSFVPFANYVYLLEAAATGKGIALGWRGLVDRLLDEGTLIALSSKHLELDRGLYAILTPRGRRSQIARESLSFFAAASRDQE